MTPKLEKWRKLADRCRDAAEVTAPNENISVQALRPWLSDAERTIREACSLIEGLLKYVDHDVNCMNRYMEDWNCECGLRKLTGEP